MDSSFLVSRTLRQTTRFRRALSSLFVCLIAILNSIAPDSLVYADNDRRISDRNPHQRWVATWATSPATSFVYIPPVAPVAPSPPTNFAPANIQPDLAFPFPDANTLSRRLHNAYGNRVSIVNEAIAGNRVVNPVTPNSTAGPAAVDRLDRDVLGLSGLTDVIWLEGINDLGGGHTTDAIIAGYLDIVGRLHARGIKVFGATLTSALGINGVDAGDNGPGHDASREVLNAFIRTSGLFDGVEDFDAATLDPSTGNMQAPFLPNSTFTQLPWDYLHPNHAGYIAMGEIVDITPFEPARHHPLP